MEMVIMAISFSYAIVFCLVWKMMSLIYGKLSPATQSMIVHIKSRMVDMIIISILAVLACYLGIITIKAIS